MDLWTIIKVVFRRWYAVAPILLLTAFAGYQIAYKAPPTYQASGSALLVAPNVVTGATGAVFKQNPYLLFSGSLNITAVVVVRVLNDTTERAALIEDGLMGDYEIGADQSTPAVGITVNGDDPDVVLGTVGRLLDDVQTNLRELQDTADAPDDLRIGVEELVRPTVALAMRGKVARNMATIGALGVLLAVGVALLLEAATASRRKSKAERRAARAGAAVPAAPVPGAAPPDGADDGPPPIRRRPNARPAAAPPTPAPATQPAPQPASQPAPQPVSQSVSQPVSQSVSQPVPVAAESARRRPGRRPGPPDDGPPVGSAAPAPGPAANGAGQPARAFHRRPPGD